MNTAADGAAIPVTAATIAQEIRVAVKERPAPYGKIFISGKTVAPDQEWDSDTGELTESYGLTEFPLTAIIGWLNEKWGGKWELPSPVSGSAGRGAALVMTSVRENGQTRRGWTLSLDGDWGAGDVPIVLTGVIVALDADGTRTFGAVVTLQLKVAGKPHSEVLRGSLTRAASGTWSLEAATDFTKGLPLADIAASLGVPWEKG
ncbi:hypothetical protein [Streptomyces sp. NPDC017988]|uniref:hypothetical protein n=1 Tax=Streptomyces sp. NPDC017988 TaxID=3365025 RepID=UPI0037BA1B5D